jgi:hypothetical protein
VEGGNITFDLLTYLCTLACYLNPISVCRVQPGGAEECGERLLPGVAAPPGGPAGGARRRHHPLREEPGVLATALARHREKRRRHSGGLQARLLFREDSNLVAYFVGYCLVNLT